MSVSLLLLLNRDLLSNQDRLYFYYLYELNKDVEIREAVEYKVIL